ncbi:lysylphosphatidylglycerol synthase transmembrane domain-containing protein [Halomarina pelagica]|uniref:lysylphosphatidylglycerol synthase transmembrane domain-containing protein n=1 Tax=Halomarina pelagica TaxID=2961599 RepID=UPI0020C35B23|nr:lysylphosphatidylglycerol synthase transmembrane domain-containing protein [Halomarina sp. BND7]
MNVNLRATVLGFLAALAVLLLTFGFVGLGPIVNAVSMADPRVVALLPLVAAAWLLAWGLSLRVVLAVIGTPVRATTAVLVYLAATFANNVTPFGQAGGEPITAYLIADVTENEYETGLAAIASVDALNFVPSLSFAAIGIAYFAATAALGRHLRAAAVSLALIATALAAGLVLGWRYRNEVRDGLTDVLTPVSRAFARLIPGRTAPSRYTVYARVDGFFVAVERVAGDRENLLLALGFATLGWLALSTSLWLSIYALSSAEPVAFAATLLVIPIGSIASITPLPGGLGGIETVLITLLVALGVDPVTAGAAVLVHRTATYWLPTLIGGLVTVTWGADAL